MGPFTPLLMHFASWSLICNLFFLQSAGFQIRSRSFPTSQLLNLRDSTNSSGIIGVDDLQNTQYVANITVGGNDFQVIIDSGSSDLWITGNVPQTQDINLTTSIQYAVGNADGNVNVASVSFAGHTISDQAFLLVNSTATFSSNLPAQGISGLVGLGPPSGSVIRENVGNSTGDSLMNRIFTQDTSTSNFISFLLQRNGDPTEGYQGEFTIGEVVPGFENITSQTQLPVQTLANDTTINQHWTIQLDKNGIIGPDGKAISKSSIVPDNDGRLYAVVDSGFTLPQVPRSVSDAIYGRVQGANYSVELNLWTIPCQQELNISFWIGGVNYPVHPLDTASSDFNLKDANGNEVCAGTFQPITSAFSLAGQFDLILGMVFLRNTYTLLDFGRFISGSDVPYVQFLSTTTLPQAHQDFVNARLGGVDTTGDSQYALLPENKGKSSPVPLDERVQHTEQKVIRYLPEIVVCSVVLVLAVIGYGIFKFVKRRRARRAAAASGFLGDKGRNGPQMAIGQPMSTSKKYVPLQDPAPPIYLQDMHSPNRPYGSYDSYSHDSDPYR